MEAAARTSVTCIGVRVAAGVLGGWAFTWGFVTLGITMIVACGGDFHDAESLAYLLAFPLYLAVLCWSIAARSLARVCVVIAGGAALMTTAAWLLARALT